MYRIKREFGEKLRTEYEHRAQPCSTCQTPGACCLDEHFVNVRITRLEASAINSVIAELPDAAAVYSRTAAAIERYDLLGAGSEATYACPLFERARGCLVHGPAKPPACMHHACYESRDDLPPNELLETIEAEIARLSRLVHGKDEIGIPLPVAVMQNASAEHQGRTSAAVRQEISDGTKAVNSSTRLAGQPPRR